MRALSVVDFERALSMLTPEAQSLLILTCRDRLDQRAIAKAAHISPRAQAYKLPAARQALASILDRLDLL